MNRIFGQVHQPNLSDIFKLGHRIVRATETIVEKNDAAHSDPEKLTVEVFDNHVYFYADVDSDRCLAMIKNIRDIDARLRSERETRNLSQDFVVPIWLHIQSDGGDLFAGLAAADQIGTIKTPVYSVVEGLSASAATLISLACQKRFIMPSGFMLIHQFTSLKWGTHEQFQDEMKLQKMLMDLLVSFYESKTKLKADKIKELLKRDSWFNSSQCVEAGLADDIFNV